MPSEVPWLGQRIRDERVRQGVSLRGLSRTVGVSASMISQIETAKSQPSVSTLYAITSALGISIEDLFTAPAATLPDAAPSDLARSDEATSDAAAGAVVVERRAIRAGSSPTAVLETLGSMRGARLGPKVGPDDRRVLTLDSGVTWQQLGELPHRAVDFLLITYPPGASSSNTGGLMRHPGSEYGFVLRGELVLTLGFEEVRLRPGDAISFESTTPHSYRNDGTEAAVGVWFVTEHVR
jgi:transcriptional regulator with XRE-family HTH domain/quercetin dioxygenase-like cupin family protein